MTITTRDTDGREWTFVTFPGSEGRTTLIVTVLSATTRRQLLASTLHLSAQDAAALGLAALHYPGSD